MDITKIGEIYDTVEKIFNGDVRPVALERVLPSKWNNIEVLLRVNNCIEVNGQLHPECTINKMLNVISMYYALRPNVRFTTKKGV